MTDAPPPLDRQVAFDLLAIGAVALAPEQPFTWASGRRAPIYCDNRLTLGFPSVRQRLADGFVRAIQALDERPDVIAGTATAGIPHAAWVADRLDLPMAYVRSKPKGHGKGNQIEGLIEPGQRVVVIEDLISTGGSSLAAVRAVQAEGAIVDAVLAIFSYGFPEAEAAFAEAAVPCATLTTLATLLEVATETGQLSPGAVATLEAWRADAVAWSEAHTA
ncbi:MAG: orotate phosphoribosyltransferase [Bacteroidota bacterium]